MANQNDAQTKAMSDKLFEYARKTTAAANQGLKNSADRVAAKAKDYAPRKTGELEDGIIVEEGEKPNSYIIKSTAPHSVYVHEDSQAKHENGTFKFLQRAIDEEAPGILVEVVKEVKNA